MHPTTSTILTFCLLLLNSLFFSISYPQEQKMQTLRPKIIIFTSKGGYGHMAASATIANILTDYDVKIVNPFETVLKSVDVVRKITFGAMDAETFYNKLMQRGWMRTLNFLIRYPGTSAIRWNRHTIEKKLYNFLREEKPDLLFSLVPCLSYPASSAAAECNIPFLLMTLDMDLTNWLIDMEKCKHPHFHITVVKKTPRITQQLEHCKIKASHTSELGFHLRPDFFETKDTTKILDEWKLPHDKPKILLMMGGVGTSKLVQYTKKLLTLNDPAHLVVCVGKNAKLASQLKLLPAHKNVSMSIVPFTTRISDLMAASDLFITKPGPNSCYEALHFGLPALIDATSPSVFWEQATLDLFSNTKQGEVIKNINQLPQLVKKYIGTIRQQADRNNNFSSKIKGLVASMLNKKQTTQINI